ncbi:7553_t:CDS:2, partial [Dentiscutata heterogama]
MSIVKDDQTSNIHLMYQKDILNQWAMAKTKYLNQYRLYEEVAIKIVKDSNKNKDPFLKELKACHSLEQYLGISRDEKTDDYIL